jgi:hypothetical protein
LGEVEEWIEVREAEINAIISNLGFTTPLTKEANPLSFLLVKQMLKEVVAAQVLRTQLAGIRDADSLGAKAFEMAWESKIRRLNNPDDPFTLPDATVTEARAKLDVIASSMVTEDPDFFEEDRVTREQVF